ncbi:MAG: phytase [Telluria sp.]
MRQLITIAAGLLAAVAAHAAPPAAALPPALAKMAELAALPDGGWLALDKKGLHLFDRGGAQRATLAMRAKQLDVRAGPGGAVAVVLDGVDDQARLVRVDLAGGALLPGAPVKAAFGVETLCLFQDAQQLRHLFVAAKDGQAEQWVLDGPAPALVRKLALPAGSKACRVDDVAQTLFVSEPKFGLWAYDAQSEAAPGRSAVALRKPFGTLATGAGAIAVLPGAVALLDAGGATLHVFEARAGQWRQRSSTRVGGVHKLSTAAGSLLLRDDGAGWKTGMALTAAATAVQPAVIMPHAQTDVMAQMGDAADDPAIWVHATDPSKSRVLGTNKKQGLLVYDMQGRQQQLLEVGRLNNVDLRQGVTMGGRAVDLAVATQRDDNSVVVFGIDAGGTVKELVRLPTDLDKIYGICLYQPTGGGLETFVNDADGRYRQYRIEASGAGYTGKLIRQFKVATQPEGCVADDRNARLFVGEEKRGLWVMAADAAAPAAMRMVLPVGPTLHADVEGVAIYHGKRASYRVVSSQGNNSYVVLDSLPPYKVRGVFRVGFNIAAGIDGTSETDGLDVTSMNLGGAYADGMLVIQDGYKHLPDGPQNFKYVRWADVAGALKLE